MVIDPAVIEIVLKYYNVRILHPQPNDFDIKLDTRRYKVVVVVVVVFFNGWCLLSTPDIGFLVAEGDPRKGFLSSLIFLCCIIFRDEF